MKDNIKYVGVVFITLFFSVLFTNAQTWTAPTQTPPAGNTNPPLHEGGTAQSKVGGLLIATGSVTNGLIVQNGNVGIGTLTPGYKIDVNGTGSFQGAVGQFLLGQDASQAPYYANALLKGSATNQDVAIALESTRLSTTQRWFFGSGSGATPNTNNFRIVDLTASNADRLNIQPTTGNVGIGMTSPTQKLDVNGYVKGTGVCIGSDCRTSWPAASPSSPTGTISYCGINIYDINSTGSGWISYKYTLCEGYLPYESGGTDAGLGVPRGCPSGYFAVRMQSSTGATIYTCMTGLSTHPSYSSPLSPRTAFGPF